jgi:transcription termination factor Rho
VFRRKLKGDQPTGSERLTGEELEPKSLAELHELAAALEIARFRALRREALIEAIIAAAGRGRVEPEAVADDAGTELAEPPESEELDQEDEEQEEPEVEEVGEPEPARELRTGVLDLMPDGFGFLRVEGFIRSREDVFVSRTQIRSLSLREGDELAGPIRPMRRSDRHPSLAEVETINGEPVRDTAQERPSLASLTPVYPTERLRLDPEPGDLAVRMVDLVSPVGKGSRCLIAAPPRGGATTLLRRIVTAAVRDARIVPIVLLLDARVEEVSDWQRSLEVSVHASAADRSADAHVQFATLALERARRLVERGDDVLLVIDSITRLARAHGLSRAGSRQAREGGEDADAGGSAGLQAAKRWFAAARNTEQAGSLTILAAARVDSGSATEELLHEALADIASCELRLDAELAQAGLLPPIDVRRSYVREEGSIAGEEAESRSRLRRSLQPLRPTDAWEQLAERIRETRSNEELLGVVLGSSLNPP